jgi:hypothetical protein
VRLKGIPVNYRRSVAGAHAGQLRRAVRPSWQARRAASHRRGAPGLCVLRGCGDVVPVLDVLLSIQLRSRRSRASNSSGEASGVPGARLLHSSAPCPLSVERLGLPLGRRGCRDGGGPGFIGEPNASIGTGPSARAPLASVQCQTQAHSLVDYLMDCRMTS